MIFTVQITQAQCQVTSANALTLAPDADEYNPEPTIVDLDSGKLCCTALSQMQSLPGRFYMLRGNTGK